MAKKKSGKTSTRKKSKCDHIWQKQTLKSDFKPNAVRILNYCICCAEIHINDVTLKKPKIEIPSL